MIILNIIHKIWERLKRYSNLFLKNCGMISKRIIWKSFIIFYKPSPVQNSSASKRLKPHILIIRNHYYSKGAGQLSTEVMHLDNTLRASDLASFEVLTYDLDLKRSIFSDILFFKKCQQMRPDAIIFSSWRQNIVSHPSLHSIEHIKNHLKIPLVAIWWDTCNKQFAKVITPLMPVFDVHVIVDNPSLNFIHETVPLIDRILTLWPPQDQSLFRNGTRRKIPVSFSGQISSYRHNRKEILDFLFLQKIPGKFLSSDRNTQISHEKYAELMRESEMCLNFSNSVDCHQLKSRVFEILFSGALLLETENDQTSKLLRPMIDYVPFKDKHDLLKKINYYQKNKNELFKIAEQGLKTVNELYNSNNFWKAIFNKLNLK